jgi:hypothetical protein
MFTIFRGSDAYDREALIQHLAKEVARVTRICLTPKAANMNADELRGYLRTRASREAREQVRHLIAEVRLPQEIEAKLTAAVLERAIHLMIRDLATCPVVAIPTPHVQSRAA